MPLITMKEIEILIQIENYLGKKEDWSDNTYKIWEVIENLLKRQELYREKQKYYMRNKRLTDPKYSRKGKQ